MDRTQRLESITKDLYDFSKNYRKKDAIGLGKEMEDAANSINHLIKVYNYGYEGEEVDLLNKQIAQKLSSLHREIRAKYAGQNDKSATYILGSLSEYSKLIKTIN